MFRLVVTASGTGPIDASTATYIAKSASAIMVGTRNGAAGADRGFAVGLPDPAAVEPHLFDRQSAGGVKELRELGGEKSLELADRHGRFRHPPPLPAHSACRGSADRIQCSLPRSQSLRTSAMNVQTPLAPADAVLLREDAGPIAVLTLNRPQIRNTLSEAMLAALAREFTALAGDRAIRVVVLTAKGPGLLGRSRPQGTDGAAQRCRPRARLFPAHHADLQRHDDADRQPAAAGDRGRAGHRHRRRLPAGGELRSRGRRPRRRNSACRASMPACSARRRWWRCRATSRASTRWRCCSPAIWFRPSTRSASVSSIRSCRPDRNSTPRSRWRARSPASPRRW